MKLRRIHTLQLGLAFSVCALFSMFNFSERLMIVQDNVYNSEYIRQHQLEIHVPGSMQHTEDIINGSWVDSRIPRKLEVLPGCAEVHLATVCTTGRELREVANLVKSVLYYSQTVSLFLHIVTNEHGYNVLQTLFYTWELTNVFPRFHIVDETWERTGDKNTLDDALTVVLQSQKVQMQRKLMVAKANVIFLQDIRKTWDNLTTTLGHRDMMYVQSDPTCENSLMLINLEKALPCYQGGALKLKRNGKEVKCETPASSTNGTSCISIPGIFGVTSDALTYRDEQLQIIREIDGDMFRIMTTPCSQPYIHQFKLDSADPCFEYRYLSRLKKRTHLYFYGQPKLVGKTSPYDVTLVTHLMPNRLGNLERQLEFWSGPVSAAVYVSDSGVPAFWDYIRRSKKITKRKNISFHLVIARQRPPYSINYLRNVAIGEVKTPFFLMLDVDFVPNPKLSQQIKQLLPKMDSTQKRAYIIPSFETYNHTYTMAKTKSQFLEDMREGYVEAYHQRKEHWPEGHKSTDFDKWKVSIYPYKVQGRFGFEPYLIIPTKGAPLYHELLLERMRDKLTYTLEVEYAGYELYVLPQSFAVHFPHVVSPVNKDSGATQFQVCSYKIYNDVVRSIRKKYGDNHS